MIAVYGLLMRRLVVQWLDRIPILSGITTV